VNLIQLASVAAVQEHVLVMLIRPCPPVFGMLTTLGLSEIAQLAAIWVKVNTCVPTKMLPVRGAGDVFAATLYPISPLPMSLAPEVMVSHDESE
jgi:hypothetical protein